MGDAQIVSEITADVTQVVIICGLTQIAKKIFDNLNIDLIWIPVVSLCIGMTSQIIIAWGLQGITPATLVIALYNGVRFSLMGNGVFDHTQPWTTKLNPSSGPPELPEQSATNTTKEMIK